MEKAIISNESGFGRFLRAQSGRIVPALCLYAGLRILILVLAFPIFNNLDEQFHFISIQMYASGEWPGKSLPHPSPESAELIAYYETYEYLNPSAEIERLYPVPYYQLPRAAGYSYVEQIYQSWLRNENYEAQSAPLYYLIGAVWYQAGRVLGVRSWELPYWVRLLNPIAYVQLIWASYRLARRTYPENVFLWLGVPALLAVFPQDVYFGINREVLSAPLTAIALLLMAKNLEGRKRNSWLLVITCLTVGLAFLVDISNCILYGALALMLWYCTKQRGANPLSKIRTIAGGVFLSLLFPLAWMLRNYLVIGDATGSRAKTQHLGWTLKPIGQIFHHPLFGWDGASYFLGNLVRTFWRGEYEWHGIAMAWPTADWLYLLSTVVIGTAFAVRVLRTFKKPPVQQRLLEWQTLVLVLGSVLFMAAISLPYDFHRCPNPSREHPFFISGRIISGALLPFAIVYVAGIESLLRPFRKWIPPAAVLGCFLLFISISEFRIRRVAFASPHNFFALRKWQRSHELPDGYLSSRVAPLSLDETSRRDQEAVTDLQTLAQQNPGVYVPYLATALSNLASVDRLQNRLDEARQNYNDSVKFRRQLAQQDPTKYQALLATTLVDLGNLERSQKRPVEARQDFEEALKLCQQLANQDPSASYLPEMAVTLNNLASLNFGQNRQQEAREQFERALDIHRQLAEEHPDQYLPDLAKALDDAGRIDATQNRIDDALHHIEESLRIYGQLSRQNPQIYLPGFALELSHLGLLNRARKRTEESRNNYTDALKVYRYLAQHEPEKYAENVARLEAALSQLGGSSSSR